MEVRQFTLEDQKTEAYLRIANVLYSHWRVSSNEEKSKLACGGHSRLFDVLIPDYFIQKGVSVNGKGHKEHVVPCNQIRNYSYNMFNHGYLVEDVAQMIKEHLIIVEITKEEQIMIDSKYKDNMPDDWEFGQDPYRRLREVEIKWESYE